MRTWILICAMVIVTGCAFTANKKDVSLTATPSSASYDVDFGMVASSGVVVIPFGETVVNWVSAAIGEVKGLLSKLDPAEEESD